MNSRAYLYRRIVQAKLFIDVNYADKLNLDVSSGEAFFSKYHFIRLFKAAYGFTPHQYLTKVRVDKAKLLLEKGEPPSDVCFKVGFESITSFTALFKKHSSLSPGKYQEACREKQRLIKEKPLRFIPNCFAEAKGWTKKQF